LSWKDPGGLLQLGQIKEKKGRNAHGKKSVRRRGSKV